MTTEQQAQPTKARVIFLPMEYAEAYREPVNMVNLLTEQEGKGNYRREHNFLRAAVKPDADKDWYTYDEVVKLVKFVHELPADKDLVIHCKYGQGRSYTVARFIAEQFRDRYRLDTEVKGCQIKNAFVDNQLLSRLYDAFLDVTLRDPEDIEA